MNNDFRRCVGNPLRQVHAAVTRKLEQRVENSKRLEENMENIEAMHVLFRNLARYELAHQFSRETIRLLQQAGLFRHKAKQHARILLQEIARFDNEVGNRFVEHDEALDIIDYFTDRFVTDEETTRLANVLKFSIMQHLTKNGCTRSQLVATSVVAAYLTYFAHFRLIEELNTSEFINPRLSTMRPLISPKELNAVQNLAALLTDELFQRGFKPDTMFAESPATKQALDNLLAHLTNAERMDKAIGDYFHEPKKQPQ